jgi:DNA-binding transcriptional ArsR family regulator
MMGLQQPLAEPFMLSPWQIQIALLPLRRPDPEGRPDKPKRDYEGHGLIVHRKRVQDANQDKIIKALFAGPRILSGIARVAKLSKQAVRQHIDRLLADGRVEEFRTAGARYYRLAETGTRRTDNPLTGADSGRAFREPAGGGTGR